LDQDKSQFRDVEGTNLLISLSGTGPLFQQLYRAMRDLILAGKLPAGAQLPPTRVLANELGLSRNVVITAYEELIVGGYAAARTGSGTFVCANLRVDARTAAHAGGATGLRGASLSRYGRKLVKRPESLERQGPPLRYDFDCAAVSPDDFPADLWRQLLARSARGLHAPDASPAGNPDLREALATYLRISRGVECEAGQILIVSGSAQALDLTTRLLLDEGDVAVLEDPHYRGARDAFLSAGARLHAIRTDEHGMVTDALPEDERPVKLAYVTPSHQFPSGGILPLERRMALLAWAERRETYVVEDDFDSEFLYDERPVEAMQGIDRGSRVIYIGTFSRALSPAMRLGYLVLPKPLVPLFVHAKHLADSHSAALPQRALCEFLRSGHFERHLRKCRDRKADLRRALLSAIEKYLGSRAEVRGAHSGVHLMLSLPYVPHGRLDELCQAAARCGLGLHPARPFYLNPPPRTEFIMGYGALTPEKIRAGIRILAELLEDARHSDWPLPASGIGPCTSTIGSIW